MGQKLETYIPDLDVNPGKDPHWARTRWLWRHTHVLSLSLELFAISNYAKPETI